MSAFLSRRTFFAGWGVGVGVGGGGGVGSPRPLFIPQCSVAYGRSHFKLSLATIIFKSLGMRGQSSSARLVTTACVLLRCCSDA